MVEDIAGRQSMEEFGSEWSAFASGTDDRWAVAAGMVNFGQGRYGDGTVAEATFEFALSVTSSEAMALTT
jgi:hypothetical protein